MNDFRDIATAPRDGTYIEVLADGEGPFEMRWDPAFRNFITGTHRGMWVARGNLFSWDESRGFGPTHWREIAADRELAA